MTIVVLGIDGLEFDLVEKYDLKNLKQRRCCKIVLDDFSVIVSPPIWASMITGRIIGEMMKNVTPIFHSTPKGFVARLKGILPWKIRRALGAKANCLKNIVEGNPMRFMSNYLDRQKVPTIFDECRSWHNSIPGLDNVSLAGSIPAKALDDGKTRRTVLRNRRLLFRKQISDLFDALSQKADFELIFWYTNWIDFTSHLEHGLKLSTTNRYMEINTLVQRVRKELECDDTLFIISDHGFVPTGKFGYHSHHGFFSSSTGEAIHKPTSLYFLIRKSIECARITKHTGEAYD